MQEIKLSPQILDEDLDHASACLSAYKADRTVPQSFGLLSTEGIVTVTLTEQGPF